MKAYWNLVNEVRKVSEIPIVLFGYFNPIFAYGVQKFAEAARRAGVDGVLVVDLPYEEAKELRIYTDAVGIDFISLIAPTTDGKRLQQNCRRSHGISLLYFHYRNYRHCRAEN